MGEQVGIQPRVYSQNNSRVLENAFRNVLREELWENFPHPDSVARLLSPTSGAELLIRSRFPQREVK